MEFLFDDEWVDYQSGVRRVLGSPRKVPEPVFGREKPWEAHRLSRCAMLFDADERKFELWYGSAVREPVVRQEDAGRESSEIGGAGRHFVCYAESGDGVHWVRPSLGLFEFQGSRDNNILAETSEADTFFYNVVKDPCDPDPSRRYKAIGFDHSETSILEGKRPGGMGLCVGYSPDGFRWTYAPRLVMDTTDLTDADCVLSHREPMTGKWVGFFRPRTRPKRRFIGYSESTDFDHWTNPRMLLTPDGGDDEWTEFYGMTVACLGRWRVGTLWVFHNNPESSPMTLELVYSRDGLHYRRAMPRVQFLPLGQAGSWDSTMLHSVSLIERGAEFLLHYTGSNSEHGSDRGQRMPRGRAASGEERRGGLGLAHVPWGQFCGLRADFDGVVETKWLCNYGSAGVQAVAAIDDGGWIRAEILDQYGDVVPGWSRDLCGVRPLGDGRLAFSWGRSDLVGRFGQVSEANGEVGHVVKIRFYLHRGTLFGFEVGEDRAMPKYSQ